MEVYETDASLARLPLNTDYPDLVLRCAVVEAIPLRMCEFSNHQVFTVMGSIAPRDPATIGGEAELLRINFYDRWGAAAAFMDPGDVILLHGFFLTETPTCAGGNREGHRGKVTSGTSLPLVCPLPMESTLRVLQKGEKKLVMEISVRPQDWDAAAVRGLPLSDTTNQLYARTCWGWEKPSPL